jgi:hypothetical protein
MQTAEQYRAEEARLRPLIRELKALMISMNAMGENSMGDLTYAEAALFHNAILLLNDLLASIHDRRARA